MMPSCDASIKDLIYLGLAIAFMLLEYWLGKTQRVKSASTVELILTAIAVFVIARFKKEEDHDPKT